MKVKKKFTYSSLSNSWQQFIVFGVCKLEGFLQIVKYLIDTAVITSRAADGVQKTVEHFTVNFLRLIKTQKQKFLLMKDG